MTTMDNLRQSDRFAAWGLWACVTVALCWAPAVRAQEIDWGKQLQKWANETKQRETESRRTGKSQRDLYVEQLRRESAAKAANDAKEQKQSKADMTRVRPRPEPIPTNPAPAPTTTDSHPKIDWGKQFQKWADETKEREARRAKQYPEPNELPPASSRIVIRENPRSFPQPLPGPRPLPNRVSPVVIVPNTVPSNPLPANPLPPNPLPPTNPLPPSSPPIVAVDPPKNALPVLPKRNVFDKTAKNDDPLVTIKCAVTGCVSQVPLSVALASSNVEINPQPIPPGRH